MKQIESIVGGPVPGLTGRTIALACFMGLMLVGCGQKGPLYLPPPSTPSPPAAQQQPTAPQLTPEAGSTSENNGAAR